MNDQEGTAALPEKKIVLHAEGIEKAFYHPVKVPILKGVNLQARQGESIAIMGRSGEGKSTLLHILGTLEQQCSGTLTIAGHNVASFNKAKIRNQYIGFVFQAFHLLDDYSVLDNILMPARIGRKNTGTGSPTREKALHLLDAVGLSGRAHFNTKLLSGGEKQRVGIARALCQDPEIILADEPSGNLDHTTSIPIQDLLLNFAKQHNKALIVVTHDQALADRCDKIYHLQDGMLVQK